MSFSEALDLSDVASVEGRCVMSSILAVAESCRADVDGKISAEPVEIVVALSLTTGIALFCLAVSFKGTNETFLFDKLILNMVLFVESLLVIEM